MGRGMALYDDIYEVIMEKKSRENYRLDKFKKEHNFIPDYSKNKFGHVGTILIDGKRIPVDLNIHSKSSPWNNLQRRNTGIQGSALFNEELMLDKPFFNLKNKKRMNSILNHEVGHLKMHTTQPNAKLRDPRFVSKLNAERTVQSYVPPIGDTGFKQDIENYWKNALRIDDYLKTGTANKSDMELRDKAWNIANKHSTNADHSNPKEFEADRYSANRSGAQHLKRALREYNKKMAKDMSTPKYLSKSVHKEYNIPRLSTDALVQLKKEMQNDYNTRMKALKDPKIRDNKLYK